MRKRIFDKLYRKQNFIIVSGLTILAFALLVGIGGAAPNATVISFNPQIVDLDPGSSQNVQIILNSVPNGLAGSNITISVSNPEIAEITAASSPSWSGIKKNSTSPVPSSSVWIKAVDLEDNINSGNTNISLGTINITAKKSGTANLTILPDMITADGGSSINPDLNIGTINVSGQSEPVVPPVVPPVVGTVISFKPQTVELQSASSQNVQIVMNKIPDNGLSGFNIIVSVLDPTTANITSVSGPSWNGIPTNSTSIISPSSVKIKAVNFDAVHAGDTNVSFGNITIAGINAGKTNLSIVPTEVDDINGNPIDLNVTMGTINVSGQSGPVVPPIVGPVLSFKPQIVELQPGSSQNVQIVMDKVPDNGLSGFNIMVSVLDPTTANITDVSGPSWNGIPTNSTSIISPSSVKIKAVNFDAVHAGDTNVSFGNITIAGINAGKTNLSIVPTEVDDINGNLINPNVTIGTINVLAQPAPVLLTPIVNWSKPADIYHGTPLSSTQLDATATDPVSGDIVIGNFSYDPAEGTILGVGQHTLNAYFTPEDTANYSNVSANVTINVLNASYNIFKSVISPDNNGDCIVNSPGDKVPYRIVVKNEGDENLTHVNVSDPMISLPNPVGDNNSDGILNPGETWIYNAIYTVTTDDVRNGSVNNTATVICDQLPEKRSSVNTPINQNKELQIYKSTMEIDEAGDHIINNPGDVITYQVAVKNIGNADLTNVTVNDPMIKLTKSIEDGKSQEVLSPGDLWVYTGSYTITQADIDKVSNGFGFITNTATVHCNELQDQSSTVTVPIYKRNELVPTPAPVKPVADFSTNTISGNAPLTVQFTDKSQNAESRSWDFNNDGKAESSEVNPVYTYTTPATYTANLTVTNANGTASKTAVITVSQVTNSVKKSSGGSSHGSGGSGGSGSAVVSSSTVSSTGKTDATGNAIGNATVIPTQNNTTNVEQSSTPANVEQTPEQAQNTSTPEKESKKTPGFGLVSCIIGLSAVFLYRKKQK
jgi:uncharacterized repeat protein (TIGR01451 family)